jgi:hypothetical protein
MLNLEACAYREKRCKNVSRSTVERYEIHKTERNIENNTTTKCLTASNNDIADTDAAKSSACAYLKTSHDQKTIKDIENNVRVFTVLLSQ